MASACVAGALSLASFPTASAQSAPVEVVIRYHGSAEAIPPPHREGTNYLVAIPTRFAPSPEKLVAPFLNQLEGENEVWRFPLSDKGAVFVEEISNQVIRIRFGSNKEELSSLSGLPIAQQNSGVTANRAATVNKLSGKKIRPDQNGFMTFAAVTAAESTSSPVTQVDANGGALPTPGIAADTDVETVKRRSLPLASLDLAVPQSPAFAILGVTPDNVIRPNSPRELALSLVNGVGKNGAFQGGIAIDTVPYLLFLGQTKSLYDYQRSYPVRLLSRTEFSFATSKGAQDKDPSLKLALGLHITLFDRGDPRLDEEFIQGLAKAFSKLQSSDDNFIDPTNPTLISDAAKRWKAAADDARKKAKDRNWNKSSWSLGAAPSWIDKKGDSGDYDWNGAAAWTSFAYGFEDQPFKDTFLEKSSQLIFHLRYRNHELIPDPNNTGAFYHEDSLLGAVRLRIGSPDFNGAFDGAIVHEWNNRIKDGTAFRVGFALERKMADNLWFHLSFGKEFNEPDGKDGALVLGSFQVGSSEESTIPTAPKK